MWNTNQSLGSLPHQVTKLQEIWRHLKRELKFRTLVYYKKASWNILGDELLKDNSTTFIVWDQTSNPPYSKASLDMDILVLSCVGEANYELILGTLSIMLNQMRHVPIWLDICDVAMPIKGSFKNMAASILKRCWELHMANVIITDSDFLISGQIYAYQPFPIFELLSLTYHNALQLFPYKLNNLHGYIIRTLPDRSEPLTIVYPNANGELVVTGMVWRVLIEFARHLNATLQLTMEPDSIVSFEHMVQYVQSESLDIAASLCPIVQYRSRAFDEFSYPLFVGSWCTMLPIERVISTHEALSKVMQSPWTYLYILIIYGVHHCLAGRRFFRSRLFRLILPLNCLILLSIFLAHLSALFISPLQHNRIENFDQLNEAGIRIMGMRKESLRYPTEMRITYSASFILQSLFPILMQHRNSFNTTYGYTVTSLKWSLYQEQQKYFQKPLFRYSTDLCVQKLAMFALVMQENCLYREELHKFTIYLSEYGLLQFWDHLSLFDMVEANRLRLVDLSTPLKAQPISWDEWVYVSALYGIGLLIGVAVFVIELIVYYLSVFLDNL